MTTTTEEQCCQIPAVSQRGPVSSPLYSRPLPSPPLSASSSTADDSFPPPLYPRHSTSLPSPPLYPRQAMSPSSPPLFPREPISPLTPPVFHSDPASPPSPSLFSRAPAPSPRSPSGESRQPARRAAIQSTHGNSSDYCDVVKKGFLYVKRPPPPTSGRTRLINLNIKTWQKRYLVLRDTSRTSDTTILDIFDRDISSTLTTPLPPPAASLPSIDHPTAPLPHLPTSSLVHPPLTPTPTRGLLSVDLRRVTHVESHLESRRFAHAFIVFRDNGSPLIFGAETDLEKRCWLYSIRLLSDKVKIYQQMTPLTLESLSMLSRRPSCPSRIGREVNHGVLPHRLQAYQSTTSYSSSSSAAAGAVVGGATGALAATLSDLNSFKYPAVPARNRTLLRLNSSPQLHRVTSAAQLLLTPRGSLNQLLLVDLTQQSSSSNQTSSYTSGIDANNLYIDLVEYTMTNEEEEDVKEEDDEQDATSRITSSHDVTSRHASVCDQNSSNPSSSSQYSGEKRKLLFKERREDSGFSESFEETSLHTCADKSETIQCLGTRQELLGSQSDHELRPPSLPKRETNSQSASRRILREYHSSKSAPLPPRVMCNTSNAASQDMPPIPPPRPIHTLR